MVIMQLNDEHAYKLSSEEAKNPLASKGGRGEGRTHYPMVLVVLLYNIVDNYY